MDITKLSEDAQSLLLAACGGRCIPAGIATVELNEAGLMLTSGWLTAKGHEVREAVLAARIDAAFGPA